MKEVSIIGVDLAKSMFQAHGGGLRQARRDLSTRHEHGFSNWRGGARPCPEGWILGGVSFEADSAAVLQGKS